MKNEKMKDITVIGAGPVGLFTAFYAGMRQASVKIIDSMPQVGGQLAALYPDKFIYDIAGFPKIKAQKLVNQLYKQAKTFSPEICLNESVLQVERLEDGTFELITPSKSHYSRSIIITAGAGAFQPRKLKVDEAGRYEDKSVHYFIKDLNVFKNRRVMVCGGGDSAVDWALALESIAETVTLIHRRSAFRAHEHSLSLLKQSTVHIKTPFEVKSLLGDESIEQVQIQEVKGENTELLPIDDLVVNYGFVTSLGPLKTWGIKTQKNAITVNSKMETNIPGIYAAGDICIYDGKPKLIATGFGEAPIAVNHAKTRIDPDAKIHAHSTHIFTASGS
ncbi:NAD(P)/FAD-dependent oxidoreductase [Virgibacillus sp. C22-A2]|uniref:Ferredoxin--NADP reductase n=1 Tax=Virgibacillus tibetensis TaxID=3042313 RepID=A0ABU6KFZ2_9BACI|nr:NAD(P)/FAD-dependent oxidoreductase [Virgibacillus sp. C22-A2]